MISDLAAEAGVGLDTDVIKDRRFIMFRVSVVGDNMDAKDYYGSKGTRLNQAASGELRWTYEELKYLVGSC